jgi:hypothetical protein
MLYLPLLYKLPLSLVHPSVAVYTILCAGLFARLVLFDSISWKPSWDCLKLLTLGLVYVSSDKLWKGKLCTAIVRTTTEFDEILVLSRMGQKRR